MSFGHKVEELVAASNSGLVKSAPGWQRVALGKVAQIINGAPFKSSFFNSEVGEPVVRIRDILQGRATTRYSGPINMEPTIDHGDLVVGMDGDFNSRLWPGDRALINQRVCKISPDESRYSKRFLAYALPGYLKLINEYTSSVTVKHLSSRTLQEIPLPYPDLGTQEAVADKIDELFSRIDEGERALKTVETLVERYRQSVLKAAVTGELTRDWREAHQHEFGKTIETGEQLLARILKSRREAWEKVELEKMLAKGKPPANDAWKERCSDPAQPTVDGLPALPDGWTWATFPHLGDFGRGKSKHRPRNDPTLYGGEYPFLQTGRVAASSGRISTYDSTYNEKGLQQSRLWPAGTVCITIAANIAASGILEFAGCFPDSVVGLICANGVVPEYVELFVRTARSNLDRYAPATAQKNINLSILEQVAVPLPPEAEQAAIRDRIDAIESRLAAAMKDTGESFTKSSSLRQSVLSAAFSGELLSSQS